ncbi:HlyD family secretion protein [Brevibacillus fulvus]|uniref:HlyD family secretion protein n=1 Tax=Brevibacillus fulvus TaxID=1125967 RepID=A0A938XZT2_9BACL|nr:biotin/lipoyl-binding protein [Brevibacillus fulvus]MBM7588927.1 HlyD family secretion protein [Brevibacillus fulvus]
MKKEIIIPAVAVAFLLGGGAMLMAKGSDPVTVASAQKGSMLTAEQINVSFQQVGGNITEVLVEEEQHVKKGDVLMKLDTTDTDLEIAQLEKQIAQLDLQIKESNQTIQTGFDKLATQQEQAEIGIKTAEAAEKQVYDGARDEDIRQQQIAVQSAQASYEDTKRTYDRTKQLYDQGAVSKSQFDSISTSLSLAEKQVKQQQEALSKMLTGATAEEKTQASLATEKARTALAQVEQARQDLETQKLAVQQLQTQKEALEVQLKSLQVKKERATLLAPQDGKIIKVVSKAGENVTAGAPVIMLETDELYYDVYLDEKQVTKIKAGGELTGHLVSLDQDLPGKVRFITAAPQFANLRMSREKGQADLAAFQVRVYVQRTEALLPGMTVEVNVDELAAR